MLISDTLREALTEKVPNADFAPYFAFIETLPMLKRGDKHHILPKKTFPEHAKNPDNLVRVSSANHFKAHYWLAVCAPQCELFQRVFFFMTKFRKYASQVGLGELARYAEVYERGRVNQAKIARVQGLIHGPINGRKNGRKNVESGHMARIQSMGGRVMGLIQGRKNAENGLLKSICARGGRLGGPIAGRKAVENGNLASYRTPEHQSKAARNAGRIAVASGQLQRICSKAGRKSCHIRWHVNRNSINPRCPYC